MPTDLDARLAEWRKSLLDTTKRNRLIKFVAGRIGGVSFVRPTAPDLWHLLVRDGQRLTFAWKRDILGLPQEILDAETLSADFDPSSGETQMDAEAVRRELLEQCLRSQRLKPTHLLTDQSDRHLAARLLRLKRLSDEAQTDHGVTTLFAAFGFLKWYESADSEEEVRSPLLLVPVKLERETVEAPFTLVAEEDDILPNHCLAEMLQTQFRIELPVASEYHLDPEDPDCAVKYFALIAERVKTDYPRWEVVADAALGVFNFQKLAMWEDLGRNAEKVKAHLVCRAIAGDNAAPLQPPGDLPTAEQLDEAVPPAAAIHILDADSSQHEAIEAVKRGAHLVMDGPPGTGKSQTIANMIAEALQAGKTVLFVSEKTAALEVVKRRLDKCGLGDFCLELHSHKANKREVVTELGRCLELKPVGAPDVDSKLSQLAESRRKLNLFVAELHTVRAPLGASAYRVHGEIAKLGNLSARSRVAVPDVFNKDAAYLQTCDDILTRLADCASVLANPTGHPWRGCKLTTFSQEAKDDARFHLTRLASSIPAAEKAITILAEAGVKPEPPSVPEWDAAAVDARSLLPLPYFPTEWFGTDPRTAAQNAIELHRAVQESRELSAKLPEFDIAAVKQAGAEVDTLGAVNADRERTTIAMSLRNRVGAVKQLADSLRQLDSLLAQLEAAARAMAQTLALPKVPQMGQLEGHVARGGVIARTGAGPRSWWDAGRRTELVAGVKRANELEENVRRAKIDLSSRFTAPAFAPESAPVVRAAVAAAGSFWSRLLPRWWGLRKQVSAWYTGAALRADLAPLAAFHQSADALGQLATAYDADLVKDETGKPQWSETGAAIGAVEELVSAGVKYEALARQDRNAIGTSAEALRVECNAFAERLTALERDFVVPDLLTVTPTELRAWFASEAAALDREALGLEALVRLLTPGQDVISGRIREAATTAARLAIVAARVRQLEEGQPTDDRVRAERAALGEELLRLLDRWKRPIPPLKGVLTEQASRERLKIAIQQNETARGGTFSTAWEHVTRAVFDPAETVSTNVILNNLPLADLALWASDRATDADRLFEWVRFVHVEREAAGAGLNGVVDEVRAGEFGVEHAAGAFRSRFLRLWLDALHQQVPVLGEFTTDKHERLVARFAELDRLSVRTAADRVRARLLSKTNRPRVRDGAPDASELGILLREVNKKRRHIPLRHLFAKMPTLLPRVKPCLMMSPLAVSTYLNNPDFEFDLVIFDEASQVRPHDAVCAIYRGKQLVVGGDPKQLPPTDFFARSGEDTSDDPHTDEGGTAAFESLLDVCLSLGICRKRLRWHYRSRREGLIAFSNKFFYGGSLITFPSADDATAPAVKFVSASDGRFKDGVNPIEAKRVAALVMEHAHQTPQLSLGVIAFSQRQQDRILDELEVLRRQNKGGEEFFAADRDERFFVKNLENVQGDERDVIFLSVGYGPDDAGKVAMRFGPLNRAGGERRLNVAVTRARRAMCVIASMTANDVDLSRTEAEGAKLLKAFLDYAERGPNALAAAITQADQRGADSPFEQDVGDELVRRGCTIHRQVGCGGYLIDLAITDAGGGKYLLGVECDGATYHSAATARDRDRLRQAVLEGLGWRLVRVWSTDWVRDRNAQVNRVLAALEAARKPTKSAPPPEPETVAAVKLKPVKEVELDFDSIEKVSDVVLHETIVSALVEFGTMPAEDLISAVSKRLGFKRAGTKIRERVATAINALTAEGKLTTTEDNLVKALAPA